MTLNRDWALAYARMGWRVVPSWWLVAPFHCACPLGPSCGTDGRSSGKHPLFSNWQNVATVDPATIVEWWENWPQAHVSVVTGRGSGIFALDVDPRSGGDVAIEEYEAFSDQGLPQTLTAISGSGGRHLIYRYPANIAEGAKLGNKKLATGVDVRGEGGQIVVAPSLHSSGNYYGWWNWGALPAEPTDELVQRLVVGASGSASRGDELPAMAEALEGVAPGERNDVLFRKACQLRRQLGDDERPAIELLIRTAGRNAGLGGEELDTLLGSAFRQNHDDRPLSVPPQALAWAAGLPTPEPEASPTEGDSEPLAPDLDPPSGAQFLLNDEGNAGRLLALRGEDLLHAKGLGWMTWTGKCWLQSEALAERWATECVFRHLVDREAPMTETDDERERLERWAIQSQNSNKISGTLRCARTRVHVGDDCVSDVFDSDPMLLSLGNGTLELETLKVRPHRRADRITMVAPVEYHPELRAPSWEEFVRLAIPQPEVRWFAQKAVGYSLTGLTDAKCFFMLFGPSNNGKSTFLDALLEVLGPYAAVSDDDVFIQGRGTEHKTVLAVLAGKRMVVVSELGQSDRLNATQVKKITGDGRITARLMKQDSFEFTPQMKLWIGTNYQPQVTDFGPAMRSRPRVIEFPHSFAGSGRRGRAEVMAEFKSEGPGILNWAIEGLRGYLAEGLEPTANMQEWMDEWFDDDDVVGQFITSRCDLSLVQDGVGASLSELYRAYVAWCQQEGMREIARRTFERDLKNRPGVQRRGGRGGRATIYGLTVRELNMYGV